MSPDFINNSSKQEFERLALPYLDDLYALGVSLSRNRADAEDLVQESLLKAFRAFETFQPGTNMKAWLFTILRNTFINQYRRKVRAPEQKAQEGAEGFSYFEEAYKLSLRTREGVSDAELLDTSKLENVLGDEVTAALDSLPGEFREVVFLADVQDLAYRDISGILNVPVGTVRSRLARGRALLQKELWNYAQSKGVLRKSA